LQGTYSSSYKSCSHPFLQCRSIDESRTSTVVGGYQMIVKTRFPLQDLKVWSNLSQTGSFVFFERLALYCLAQNKRFSSHLRAIGVLHCPGSESANVYLVFRSKGKRITPRKLRKLIKVSAASTALLKPFMTKVLVLWLVLFWPPCSAG
jgi:hypothetical protein